MIYNKEKKSHTHHLEITDVNILLCSFLHFFVHPY